MSNRLSRAPEGLDETMLVWNGMVSCLPALTIDVSTVREVIAAVRFARDHGLRVRVVSQGPPFGGTPVAEHSVTLNLAQMRGLSIDAESGLVHAGPGCPAGSVERAAAERGYSVAALAEVEVVTEDGRVLRASADRHAELFGAVTTRAEPGIVTRLTWNLRRLHGG